MVYSKGDKQKLPQSVAVSFMLPKLIFLAAFFPGDGIDAFHHFIGQ